MTSAALLCRKVAIRHPALMLRQLPQLGWLLRGRAHLTPREFRNKQHKLFFVNALAILELLQPLVFQESQADALNLCLEPFFDVKLFIFCKLILTSIFHFIDIEPLCGVKEVSAYCKPVCRLSGPVRPAQQS